MGDGKMARRAAIWFWMAVLGIHPVTGEAELAKNDAEATIQQMDSGGLKCPLDPLAAIPVDEVVVDFVNGDAGTRPENQPWSGGFPAPENRPSRCLSADSRAFVITPTVR